MTATITIVSSSTPWAGFNLEDSTVEPWEPLSATTTSVLATNTAYALPAAVQFTGDIGAVYTEQFSSARMQLRFSGPTKPELAATVWSSGFWTALGAC